MFDILEVFFISLILKRVAYTPYCGDEFLFERLVYLASEISYVNIDHICVTVVVISPYIFKNLFTREHHVLVDKKVFEKIEFSFSQIYFLVVANDLVLFMVQRKIAGANKAFLRWGFA